MEFQEKLWRAFEIFRAKKAPCAFRHNCREIVVPSNVTGENKILVVCRTSQRHAGWSWAYNNQNLANGFAFERKLGSWEFMGGGEGKATGLSAW